MSRLIGPTLSNNAARKEFVFNSVLIDAIKHHNLNRNYKIFRHYVYKAIRREYRMGVILKSVKKSGMINLGRA